MPYGVSAARAGEAVMVRRGAAAIGGPRGRGGDEPATQTRPLTPLRRGDRGSRVVRGGGHVCTQYCNRLPPSTRSPNPCPPFSRAHSHVRRRSDTSPSRTRRPRTSTCFRRRLQCLNKVCFCSKLTDCPHKYALPLNFFCIIIIIIIIINVWRTVEQRQEHFQGRAQGIQA